MQLALQTVLDYPVKLSRDDPYGVLIVDQHPRWVGNVWPLVNKITSLGKNLNSVDPPIRT